MTLAQVNNRCWVRIAWGDSWKHSSYPDVECEFKGNLYASSPGLNKHGVYSSFILNHGCISSVEKCQINSEDGEVVFSFKTTNDHDNAHNQYDNKTKEAILSIVPDADLSTYIAYILTQNQGKCFLALELSILPESPSEEKRLSEGNCFNF
jgi:hypothetical protein